MEQRKIEGYYDPTRGTKYDEDVRLDLDHADFVKGPNHVPATLIIGGKGFTEAEHEAEFQRRARLMMIEATAGIDAGSRIGEHLKDVAAKYGIAL